MNTATNPTPLIELTGINKRFGDHHVLRDVDLTVAAGERVVICGPSGSGKSTMIRRINCLEAHDKGNIVVNGVRLEDNTKQIAGGAALVWCFSSSIYFHI